ncbi:recombination regulator RecX [Bacillus sp. FJAT-42376]|uniref:recombination regulator RecX n=1 Tax=Bacillus sp. FJAT-42376 TaxID=2014076 RepID=UPI000F4D56CB|nr:recombination regulator RecX [Bacillus sp. FJAT-42376]AZB41889.1 recombination regulator RecX [Bacillus sp. FJAT-42376]
MAFVTKITSQQKNAERYNIYLDYGKGEEFGFGVDEHTLIKFGLAKGKELSDLDIAEITTGDQIRKAYNSALDYLSYRMRSTKEIKQQLEKKEFQPETIQEVLHQLDESGLTNDQQFADAYTRTQWQAGKGPDVIKQELFQKGIAQTQIEQALSLYGHEDQLDAAMVHAEKFLRKNHAISTIQVKQKLEQLLVRKGYSFNLVSEVLRSVDYGNNQNEEREALAKQAAKVSSKYNNGQDYANRQKMKQYLYRKGFPIELIDEYLENPDQFIQS